MKSSNWNYYSVKIIKQIMVLGKPDPDLIDEFYGDDGKQHFEESLMLVHAQSPEHAYKIAQKIAIKDEKPYPNKYGEQVIWKFIKAVDCYMILDKLTSGTELYSCLHTVDKYESAIDFIDKWFRRSDE